MKNKLKEYVQKLEDDLQDLNIKLIAGSSFYRVELPF